MHEEELNFLAESTEEHPRPQFRRKFWYSLNGIWDFHIDPRGLHEQPADVPWDRTITVPFSPESNASGIAQAGFYSADTHIAARATGRRSSAWAGPARTSAALA